MKNDTTLIRSNAARPLRTELSRKYSMFLDRARALERKGYFDIAEILLQEANRSRDALVRFGEGN